ncbi:tyrosine-type recombinase/integrase [Tropicimonas aquimaris]|uniref:Tyrosine-type recombinase/integrase n=1 Tax=Tropicimonas aquimaris TaxID=914152 RepID=A0ABW3IS71_9RHOB
MCSFLALLETLDGVNLTKSAIADLGKRMRILNRVSEDAVDGARKRLLHSSAPDAILRHRLWVRLADALAVPSTIPLSSRSARRAASALAVRSSERLTPAVVAQRKKLDDESPGGRDAFGVRKIAAEALRAGQKSMSPEAPLSFPDLVHEELLNLMADESLVSAAAEQADPEIREALRKAHTAAQAAMAAGGSWAVFAAIVGNAGFLPYILAAKLSAWIPLVGGPALVSLLAILVNPVMRVRLKGVNSVRKVLADESTHTYHYAWKGGPRLPGKPGDPEVVEAYHSAVRAKREQPKGTLQAILKAYQDSQKFQDLAPRTRRDYIRHIRKIEDEYHDFPIDALTDRAARGEFLSWRDRMAKTSRRQADYTYSVLALIIAWAFDRGLAPANPCERPGKLYRSKRIDSILTTVDEAAFLRVAPPHVGLAFMLALWTGQRQGDLLRLPWSAYDGEKIRLKQRKTGARVEIPVGAPLKEVLDKTSKNAVTILSTSRDASWTESGFRASWAKACKKAGVEGVTFHDLRGTAVTRLAVAECSVPEIASITGHSLKQVAAILDAHYLSRDSSLGVSAIRKLEAHEKGTKIPNRPPNRENASTMFLAKLSKILVAEEAMRCRFLAILRSSLSFNIHMHLASFPLDICSHLFSLFPQYSW